VRRFSNPIGWYAGRAKFRSYRSSALSVRLWEKPKLDSPIARTCAASDFLSRLTHNEKLQVPIKTNKYLQLIYNMSNAIDSRSNATMRSADRHGFYFHLSNTRTIIGAVRSKYVR
jgi:hypothetical protein